LEDVTVHGGHKVLMKVDNNTLQIVGDTQEILDKQISPQPTHLLDIIVYLIAYYYIRNKI